MKLRDKVAIITGAGRGIGRATALTLARQGAAISLAARTAAEIEAVAREVRELGAQALPVVTDITREIEAYGQSNPLFGPLTRAEVGPPPDSGSDESGGPRATCPFVG